MNTLNQTAIVSEVKFFEGTVRMFDINIDFQRMRFSLMLQTKAPFQRSFIKAQKVEGNITYALSNWFTLLTKNNVRVSDDNERGFKYVSTQDEMTNYMRHLTRKDLPIDTPLSQLVFECDSFSENFDECPFRLAMVNGRNTLTSVRENAKRRISTIDPNTGETIVKFVPKEYIIRNGKAVAKPLTKDRYRRLVVNSIREVEVLANA